MRKIRISRLDSDITDGILTVQQQFLRQIDSFLLDILDQRLPCFPSKTLGKVAGRKVEILRNLAAVYFINI